MFALLPIDVLLIAAGTWLALGLAGLAAPRNFRYISKVLFPLGAAVAVLAGLTSLSFLGSGAETAVLAVGLPGLPFHLRLDNLAAVFVLLLGFAAAGISVFAAGYFRKGEGAAPGLLCLQYHFFLAAMLLVLLADDAYAFMVAWEGMALSSFFLVTTDHRHAEIRRAGYLYLLIAHVGAIAILLCFGLMASGSGDYTFAGMRAQSLPPFWASAAWLLALLGFGAKAGLLPVHVWLPEAHPAAPSPVSAMMSGVMLKTAIYGLLRVSFDLLGEPLWWWGVVAMAVGLATALFGVLYSTVQSDMKRLLAYSSIENIGLIAVALGLTLLFHAYRMAALAALAMTALLYHCLAHAGFKSLLFLCTGSVLHATKERSLGRLGGLIHRMPWVAWLALAGVIAGAGLPPLSGFVSEWLLLQGFLFSPGLPHPWLNMVVPVAAAVVALVAALAGFAMVKFYGIVFLGRMREEALKDAHDAGRWERAGLVWLAVLTFLLGVLPTTVIRLIDAATRQLLGAGLADKVREHGWWLLAPISPDRASYAPLVFLAVIAAAVLLGRQLVHRLYHGRLRRSPAWDCGYVFQGPRAQDTAEGFSQPIRRIFEPMFRMERHFPTVRDEQPYYSVKVEDHFWNWLYLPLARFADGISRLIIRLQGGRIAIYLLYSFLTLIVLLLVARP
ncbi:MAG: hydrogenase 4 subunit B [Rhodocyclaceae bacterium]|jgi:formate hydrogenlyase subunit 3/multisubunit Na+/H+ antiporter MnhD subunit|uniref:Hydrogenase 4 subunit B n=1 Tax=Candidatus Desulfobacillus denitrificans TaxID=2608985 RepID=A0A809QXG5_9PROT|nr:hydrogenase 4 subunit B [Rhodocyclaceae bacterium]MCQ3922820.1 hydrogenase 4 subunit B [Rhodocyclaceae bacterium]BBO20120.1 hydrogenase 4 subunit B [Candidatus Desulfobacillus denitrificans]HNQ56594.1 hydrogenase 4 subunit B [Candidatus Desulfobacillus denitrificans]HNT62060.1 hydrogenase 4 subunit B [Candidatus Desulfobacillus denitrificans]